MLSIFTKAKHKKRGREGKKKAERLSLSTNITKYFVNMSIINRNIFFIVPLHIQLYPIYLENQYKNHKL